MRDGQQIAQFGKSVDEKLAAVRNYLPDDLVIARTPDQPLQVKENIDLFLGALYEAIILVVVVSVDDPVVAGDSIKRGLAEGHPSVVASWLGPTKLATAIMFATITNIAAYIPFLMLIQTPWCTS